MQPATSSLKFDSFLGHVISMTIKIYSKILRLGAVVAAYYGLLIVGRHFIEVANPNQLHFILIIGSVLFIPILAAYGYYQAQWLIHQPVTMWEALKSGFGRILPLMSAIIGILIMPALLLAVLTGIIIFSINSDWENLVWPVSGLFAVIILLLLNTNLLSLIIVLVTDQDAMRASDRAKKLLKGSYLKSLTRSTTGFILLILTYTAPLWIGSVAELTLTQSIAISIAACLDVLIVTPFFWTMMIVDFHQLELNLSQSLPMQEKKKEKTKEQKIKENQEPIQKNKLNDDEWF